jgi:hypothetical protein
MTNPKVLPPQGLILVSDFFHFFYELGKRGWLYILADFHSILFLGRHGGQSKPQTVQAAPRRHDATLSVCLGRKILINNSTAPIRAKRRLYEH